MQYSFPKASQINLTINGTQAIDKITGTPSSAEWVNDTKIVAPRTGTLHYNFSSNFTGGIMIYAQSEIKLTNETNAEGSFIAKWNDEIVNWNVTIANITYPEISDVSSYEKYVNYSFPSTWNVSKIFNGTGTDDEITDGINYTQNNRKICYFGTSNSTFWLNATDLNHVTSVGAYNFTDNQTWNPYYMNETLYINSTYTLTESGNNSLIIYDPNNNSLSSYEKVAMNNFTDHTWKINDDSNVEGIHHLKVIVKTPMEVGINFTDVNCQKNPTNLTIVTNSSFQVNPGTNVEISIFYNDTRHDDPISNANITTDWSALFGGYSWNDFGNGYYNITFYTDAAISGTHNATIDALRWGFEDGIIEIEIEIISGAGTTTKLIDNYYDNGTVNFSTPNPFPDDGLFPHSRPIRIDYRQSVGNGIKGASITAIPSWRVEALQFIDRFTIQEGYYDILIDTSGLSSFSNYSDIYWVNYTISKTGYDTALGSFFINVTRINETYLELDTTGFNTLECYEGEEVDIACSFMDLYHEQPIIFDEENPGTVNWMIYNESDPGSYIIEPQEMERSIVEYQDTIKPYQFNLAPGLYNVTIETNALKDYVNFSKNISLFVKDKLNTTLTFNYTVDPGNELRVGAEISITAHLVIENQSLPQGSQLYNGTNKVINFAYENDTYPLVTNAEGKATLDLIITQYDHDNNFSVNITYDGTEQIDAAINTTLCNLTVLNKYNVSMTVAVSTSEVIVGDPIKVTVGLFIEGPNTPLANRTILVIVMFDHSSENIIVEEDVTNAQGYVTLTIIIPIDAGYIQVYAQFAGESTINNGQSAISANIKVLSTLEIIIENLWWMILIAAVAVGGILAYYRGIRVPRRKRLLKKQKTITNKILDSQNLVHILIMIKQSGQNIYNESFGEHVINPDLISGFLTAIKAFQQEIKVKKRKLAADETGFELNYAQFKILLMDGVYINVALVLNRNPTSELKQALSLFITKFEQRHVVDIKQWNGALSPFKNTHELLDDVLNLKYQNPLTIEKYDTKSVGPLEQVLCLMAENLQEKKKYFTIEDLNDRTRNSRPEPVHEIMYSINSLINRNIFKIQSKEFYQKIKEEKKLNLDSIMDKMQLSKKAPIALKLNEIDSETTSSWFYPVGKHPYPYCGFRPGCHGVFILRNGLYLQQHTHRPSQCHIRAP